VGKSGDAGGAETGVDESARGETQDTEGSFRQIGPGNVDASLPIHCCRPEKALLTEADFAFAATAERRVEPPPSRQTQNEKAATAQTLKACDDDDSAGRIKRKFGSKQFLAPTDEHSASGSERAVRLAVGKQTIDRKRAVSESIVPVEVARRSGEHDFAVGLTCNPHNSFLGVRPDRLPDESTTSECAIDPPAPVEPNERNLSSNAATDQYPTTSVDSDAACRVEPAERCKDTPISPEGRIERTGGSGCHCKPN
jgi:hypothetical protein